MVNCGIYGLIDSERDRVVYVGRGFDIAGRYRSHLADGRRKARQAIRHGFLEYPIIASKQNCLAYLWLEGIPVDLAIIEECSPDIEIQDERERYWGIRLIEEGHPLSNGTRAGSRFPVGRGLTQPKPSCPYSTNLSRIPGNFWKTGFSGAATPIDGLAYWGRLRKDPRTSCGGPGGKCHRVQ